MTAVDAGPDRIRGSGPAVAIVGLTIALIATMAVALTIGSVALPLESVLGVLSRRMGLGDYNVSLLDDQIVWQLRLPRVLGAAATGAGLAIAGAVLQSLTRNDLADPYLLGLSGGATVGAVSVIVLGVSIGGFLASSMVAIGAFAGALAALAVVLALATSRAGDLPPARTVLAGVAVAQICAAYTSFIVIMSGDHDAARQVLSWTLGSIAGVRWSSAIFLVIVAIVATAFIMAFASDLDAFAFGESAAGSLGVKVNTLRWGLMIGTALVTACLVSFTGAIGFVGLVIPHIVRLTCGPRHHLLLPMSALGGAILLVWADTLARSLVDGQEIPVGVVTAAMGAPVFGYLLRREGRGT